MVEKLPIFKRALELNVYVEEAIIESDLTQTML
jgi:hypothetical protein